MMDERRLIPPGHGERGRNTLEAYCACGRPSAHAVNGRCPTCGRPTDPCPHCDGHGFMAGAHTEGVVPCPYCEGSGMREP